MGLAEKILPEYPRSMSTIFQMSEEVCSGFVTTSEFDHKVYNFCEQGIRTSILLSSSGVGVAESINKRSAGAFLTPPGVGGGYIQNISNQCIK